MYYAYFDEKEIVHMEKMKFEQFADAVVEKIREYLPETFANATVELNTIVKNNDTHLTGLTIRGIEQNISPTIYLEQFFERYQDGEDMSDVLERIADVRISHELSERFDTEQITEFDRVKDKIVPKLVNKDWNEELLKDRVHSVVGDLAITYQILLSQDFSGNASVTITNQIMKMWSISLEELHALALDNMKKLTPSTFEPMSKVLASMLGEDAAELFASETPSDELMWVLSNRSRINGAAALLDKNIMQSVIDTIGSSFYILPSSIHECIVVAASDDMDVLQLTDMIQDVNAGQVAPDERLSDHPYRYSVEEGLLSV